METKSHPLKILDPNLAQPLFEDLCQRFKTPEKADMERVGLENVFQNFPIAPEQNLEQMCGMATRYFQHFSRRRPLPCHNLKMGLALTLTFLRMNHIDLMAKEIDLYQVALDTAYQEMSLEEFSSFLFTHASCNTSAAIWTLYTAKP